MPRTMSIWLPELPLDRLRRCGDPRLNSGPFAIIAEQKNAWRVLHGNDSARKAGIAVGLPLADARAICPDLLSEPCDPVRENILLRALWRWADIFSPRISLDPPDGLLLDITGCAHLFGGEQAMAEDVLQRLCDLNIRARIGAADTKGAARAFARFGDGVIGLAGAGETSQALSKLPMAALGLEQSLVTDLARTGLTTIGQLYQQTSSELARRFGLGLTKALSAATGQSPDPITPKAADPVYAARMTLPEPIGFQSDLEEVLARLAHQVCKRLDQDQKGARQFHLTVRCVDTGDHHMSIGFARPCFDCGPVLRQFSHPLSKLEIEYGADWFRLTANHVEPIRLRQVAMGEQAKRDDHRFHLIEMLGNRIGFDHVRVFQACNNHLPECEYIQVEAVHAPQSAWVNSPRERPARLFNPPEYIHVDTPGRPPLAFKWRRMSFDSKKTHGPERLTPRWHSDDDLRTRDYWKVQTAQGRRLWLLTYPGTETPDWYVAGEFA